MEKICTSFWVSKNCNYVRKLIHHVSSSYDKALCHAFAHADNAGVHFMYPDLPTDTYNSRMHLFNAKYTTAVRPPFKQYRFALV